MSDSFSLDTIHFIFFVIPGFITVWTYRYATYSEKKGDFELLGLSFFWGIFIAGFYAHFSSNKENVAELFKNPYATALALSMLGSLSAFLLSSFREKNRVHALFSRIKLGWFLIVRKFSVRKK